MLLIRLVLWGCITNCTDTFAGLRFHCHAIITSHCMTAYSSTSYSRFNNFNVFIPNKWDRSISVWVPTCEANPQFIFMFTCRCFRSIQSMPVHHDGAIGFVHLKQWFYMKVKRLQKHIYRINSCLMQWYRYGADSCNDMHHSCHIVLPPNVSTAASREGQANTHLDALLGCHHQKITRGENTECSLLWGNELLFSWSRQMQI